MGSPLIHNAQNKAALNTSQYSLPGLTCQSAIWNKVLFCDIFFVKHWWKDATAAFDRVLHSVTFITCRRLGMPAHACKFLLHLLKQMEFHILTGYGMSNTSFRNDKDPLCPGQGMLQGSSSAAPVYNINSDVSLTIYCRLAAGATFVHPISNTITTDHAAQYVDDKTDMLNLQGIITTKYPNSQQSSDTILQHAQRNANIWSSLLWISGGVLNGSKCFFYHIRPIYNFQTNNIKYLDNKGKEGINLRHPSTQQQFSLTQLNSKCARRTIGATLSPSGLSGPQIALYMQKIEIFAGKLSHCRLPNHLLWKALKMVLEPGILYPLMATLYSKDELYQLECQIAKLYCHVLGLNEHPRAVLHGPCELGGMDIPSLKSILKSIRVNYFLYHTRQQTQVGIKLELSLAHLQIEVSTLSQMLETSFSQFGHLGTHSLIKCIWEETSNVDLHIKGHDSICWTPQAQHDHDKSIMEYACYHFSKHDTLLINRCRLYVRVITPYDLFTHDGSRIHPKLLAHEPIISRISNMKWINISGHRKDIGRHGIISLHQ